MGRDNLGQELIDAGWKQGALLPALPAGTHFWRDDPLTGTAKAAERSLKREKPENSVRLGSAAPGHAMGFGHPKGAEERMVVISQTCDIKKKPSVEPEVLAIRAFVTANTEVLRLAGGNSTRQFLLDESRGLVAEFSNITSIEKPLLAQLKPEPGAADELTQRRFAEWIAYRFKRPAHDEQVVGAVVGPVLEKLKELKKAGDPVMHVLEHVREIRFVRLQGPPPYEVQLLFMVDQPGLTEAEQEALSLLVARLHEAFVPPTAQLIRAAVRHPYELVLGDFLDTDKLDLDYYTYRGRTIEGLGPIT